MDIATLKSQISDWIDAHSRELCDLSRSIHDNPELGFHEHQAAEWLAGYLAQNGFRVERGLYGLPTSFKATFGEGHPALAFLAEYDALPQLGHACGHNLIGVSSAAAGVAARAAAEALGGRILVIGTPAEELYGGKVTMAQKGAFTDLDAAMMVHPGSRDSAVTEALACQGLTVEFFGKSAHAAARPERGVNALAALIISFNSLDALRQHISSKARVHGIITDGGQAANVVPAHSAASFLVRAGDMTYLEEVKEKVLNCFKGAAVATGCRLEHKWDELCYAPMLNNLTLGRLFVKNLRQLGRKAKLIDRDKSFGSTDFGNVSQLVPGIHASVGITQRGVVSHSPQFAEAAVSEKGFKGMLDAAKALAMTAADLLAEPANLEKAQDEFKRQRQFG
jgi:amidohydrolase